VLMPDPKRVTVTRLAFCSASLDIDILVISFLVMGPIQVRMST
jgi:hypothetical protein